MNVSRLFLTFKNNLCLTIFPKKARTVLGGACGTRFLGKIVKQRLFLKVRKTSCFLIFGMLFTGCASIKKPFLWEVEKDGRRAYILGTIHQGVEAEELPELVIKKMHESDAVAFEVTDEFSPEGIKKSADQEEYESAVEYYRKNKIQVSSFFTVDEWSEIKRRLETYKHTFALQHLEEFSPKLISKLLNRKRTIYVDAHDMYTLRAGYMDKNLYSSAVESGKTIIRLDSRPVLERECADRTYVLIVKGLLRKEVHERANLLVDLADAYRTGDASEVIARSEYTQMTPQARQCLIEDRNRKWTAVIEQSMQKNKQVFVAAGILHFLAEPSVLDFLKQKNYKIQRVESDK